MPDLADVVVIVNPVSGAGRSNVEARGRQRAEMARAVLAARQRPGRVVVTERAGHAHELARDAVARGAALIVAWGGDGTVNDVGRALAFGRIPLGVVPGGSGNGLALALGVSREPARALHQALEGRPRAIDAGELGGRLFFNVAGIGFDAHVARIFNQPGSRRGFSHYLATSLVELFRYQVGRYTLRLDDRAAEHEALMIVLANGTQYGNGARVAPDARLDDGLIDLVIIETATPLRNVLRARHLFDGSIARRRGVFLSRVSRATIDGGSIRMSFHADGESVDHQGPLELRVHPGALLVVA